MAMRSVNWWLVAAGIVLLVCGAVVFAAPDFFLEFLTLWAGAGFLVSGAAGVMSYFRARRAYAGAVWFLLMAVLDLVLGALFLVHPFALADMLPWLLGLVFMSVGAVQVVGVIPFAKVLPDVRVIAVISGVLAIIVGVMFIVWPASLSVWVAAFVFIRGITLIAMGFTAR